MEKYYIPDFEEFHIGFRFEVELPFVGYFPIRFQKDKIVNSELDQYTDEFQKVAHSNIRVKKLDKQDIEECGFELKIVDLGEDTDEYPDIVIGDCSFGKFYGYGSEIIGNHNNIELLNSFYNIKNYNEFKRLVDQLGIKKIVR